MMFTALKFGVLPFLFTVFFWFSVYLWKFFFSFTDGAISIFLPLLGLFFWATWDSKVTAHRNHIKISVKENAFLFKLLSGKYLIFCKILIFILVSLSTIAWQGLSFKFALSIPLVLLTFISGFVGIFLYQRSKKQFHNPYTIYFSSNVTVITCSLVFIPLMTYVHYNFSEYPGELKELNLRDTVLLYINGLPERRGVLSELLSALYALDGAIIWFVLQNQNSIWAPILLSLKSSFICIIFIKISAVINIAAFKVIYRPG
jgi:hypothetical protein